MPSFCRLRLQDASDLGLCESVQNKSSLIRHFVGRPWRIDTRWQKERSDIVLQLVRLSNPVPLSLHRWDRAPSTPFKCPPENATETKKHCSSIFKQLGGLSQQGSLFDSCNMPRSLEREGDGKTRRQLFEWRIGVDIGTALFRPAADWGGLGNAMPE